MSVVGFDFGNESCIISVCRKGGLDVLQVRIGHCIICLLSRNFLIVYVLLLTLSLSTLSLLHPI
jgi:hypothetical protein